MGAPDDQWVEVVARVAAVDAEPVADAMRAGGAEGVAIEPALRVSDTADFEYEELAELPWTVRATFRGPLGDRERRALRARLRALSLSERVAPLRYQEVAAADWAEEWKQFYRVQHVGRRLVVRPSWEAYSARPGEVVIDLDPGAAFGTGEHETTRLCLAALERAMLPSPRGVGRGPQVLDVGAGSGILSIAAARLGAAEVRAVDVDEATVEIARENALRNGVALRVTFAAGSLGEAWPWPARPARASEDVVLANISSTVLVALMPLLAEALRPGGLLIASGFIARDGDEVRGAISSAGLREIRVDQEGEWVAVTASRVGVR